MDSKGDGLAHGARAKWILISALTMGASAVACTPAKDASSLDRKTARAAILTVATAVAVADGVCATTARDRIDATLAKTCADAYDAARPALLAAESGVDAWDSGQQHDVACAANHAITALQNMGDALTRAGVTWPSVVTDALSISRTLQNVGGGCHGG